MHGNNMDGAHMYLLINFMFFKTFTSVIIKITKYLINKYILKINLSFGIHKIIGVN